MFWRVLLKWIPFSVGDLLYFFMGICLLIQAWKFILLLRNKRFKINITWLKVTKVLGWLLLIYCIFLVFWGLNYYRQGIAYQLKLDVKPYNIHELTSTAGLLQQRVNYYAARMDSLQRNELKQNSRLFEKGVNAYQQVTKKISFLEYANPSIKASIYSSVGHYFGFTGYYNPFTGEAQLNTTVPVFLRPFIICHEIGHQLGYAKENEASFVAYLSCKEDTDIYFRYSVYYELFRDAVFELLRSHNREVALQLVKGLHQRVTRDNNELKTYFHRKANFVEPWISGIYDKYLKLNNQPKGKATYNEVLAWLIAYVKKNGESSI